MGHGSEVTPAAGFPACHLLAYNVLMCALLSLKSGTGNRTLFSKISVLNDYATVAAVATAVPHAAKRNSVVLIGQLLCFVADGSGLVVSVPVGVNHDLDVGGMATLPPPVGSPLAGMQLRLRSAKRSFNGAGNVNQVYGVRSDGVWSTSIVNGLTPVNDVIDIRLDDFAMLTSGHMVVVSGEMISLYQHITSCPLGRTTLQVYYVLVVNSMFKYFHY